MPVIADGLPNLAVIGLDRPTVLTRHAQVFELDALGVEHPKDVMVRDNEQIDWRAELVVRVGKQTRIDVPVRADQRHVFDRRVQLSGKLALGRVRREVAVF